MFLNSNNTLNGKKILAAAIAVVAVCAAGIVWFDTPVYLFLRKFDWVGWGVLDIVFAAKIWLAVSFVLAGIIFIKNNLKTKCNFVRVIKDFKFRYILSYFRLISNNNSAFLIFCSVLCASVVAGVSKVLIGRARPIFLEALNHTGFYPLNFEWAFNSMPSGHAAASFAGCIMIWLLLTKAKGRRQKWLLLHPSSFILLPCIVAVSRVCHGAHFPSDVILSAFIGILAADIVYAKLTNNK